MSLQYQNNPDARKNVRQQHGGMQVHQDITGCVRAETGMLGWEIRGDHPIDASYRSGSAQVKGGARGSHAGKHSKSRGYLAC